MKKTITIILFLAVILSAVACGGTNGSENGDLSGKSGQNDVLGGSTASSKESAFPIEDSDIVEETEEAILLKPTPDEYFEFTLTEDGTYQIKAKDKKNMPSFLLLPSEHEGIAVTSIDKNAFMPCDNLQIVIIPDSVTSIGDCAFAHCYGLTSVTLSKNLTSIDKDVFHACENLKSIIIPEGVTSIGQGAFERCKNLTSVIIPESVTSIGQRAFIECKNLTSVIIPNGVETIDPLAFCDTGIKTVTIPASIKKIDLKVFSATALTSVNIQDGVTKIDECAFSWCTELTSVTIPVSVTSIRLQAFKDCPALAEINYLGTKDQWQSLGKASSWDENTGSYIVHCTDGDIKKGE